MPKPIDEQWADLDAWRVANREYMRAEEERRERVRVDGRNRLVAAGDRVRKRDDLLEIIAACVLHRQPSNHTEIAIDIAELVLRAFASNNLRIIWKPRPPEALPGPPSYPGWPRGKSGRARWEPRDPPPLPRMGESFAEAADRRRRESETKDGGSTPPGSSSRSE